MENSALESSDKGSNKSDKGANLALQNGRMHHPVGRGGRRIYPQSGPTFTAAGKVALLVASNPQVSLVMVCRMLIVNLV